MDPTTIRRLLAFLRNPTTTEAERGRTAELLWASFDELPHEMMVEVAEVLVTVQPWARSAVRARHTPLT